jgi:RHS repeat-associated protein
MKFRGLTKRLVASATLWLGLIPAVAAQTTTVEYIHTDALGSPVATSDAAGNITGRQIFEPYGASLTPSPADGPGFAGHVLDAASGLSYMQQRYFDPDIGRFVSVDPLYVDLVQGKNFNRFYYAEGNPYTFVDRDGRESGPTFKLLNEQANGGPVIPPPRSPEDWLGPTIGVALASMLATPAPAEIAAVWRLYRLYRVAEAAQSPSLKGYDDVVSVLRQGGGAPKQTSASGSRTTQYSMSGGQKSAKELFDNATAGSSTVRGDGQLGRMQDGTVVHMSSRTLKDGTRETSVRFSRDKTGSHIKEVTKARYRE